MFNSCNEPYVTSFISSQSRRLFPSPFSHSYDKTKTPETTQAQEQSYTSLGLSALEARNTLPTPPTSPTVAPIPPNSLDNHNRSVSDSTLKKKLFVTEIT